ncbi:MAG: hypothetical protein ABR95_12420 [Sphingobacteriales bacterium BACL12 MAG-120813-bin55]|jgi:mono/diheme cytochrome c family protein|nr:MAG: hypothetical protein ABR94_01815 [Sphingobacteriales bacterium BACL12 MAG-120802-bin5]KRP12222.1 MAG: hypothetical protein ABR95_12420 [Sphingobacteriales bacterium BACL12 MAG-120813-bin55]
MRKWILVAGLGALIACSSADDSGENAGPAPVISRGEAIYNQNCKLCHGSRGNLGVSGAFNLRQSTLTVPEKIQVITNGRNGMAAYKGILSDEEILLVATYTESLHD